MSPIELKQVLSKNIKKYRKQKGLSQFALAEKAGVSEDTIKSIELMRQWPSEKTFCQIADAFEIEPFCFFLPEPDDFNFDTKYSLELKNLIAQNVRDYVDEILKKI